MFSLHLIDCTRTGARLSQGTLWWKYLLCCRFWWDSQQLNVSALSYCIKTNILIVGLKEITSRNRLPVRRANFYKLCQKLIFLVFHSFSVILQTQSFLLTRNPLEERVVDHSFSIPTWSLFFYLSIANVSNAKTHSGFWCWNHGCCNKMNQIKNTFSHFSGSHASQHFACTEG